MVDDSTVVVLDIVVRSKGLIGIAAEVDIVVAMVGIDRSLLMVDTTEKTVADTGSRVLCRKCFFLVKYQRFQRKRIINRFAKRISLEIIYLYH